MLRSPSDEVTAAVVVTAPLARTRTVAVTLVLCRPSMNTSGQTDVRPDEIWQPEPFSAYVDTRSSASGSVKLNETLLALAPVAFRSTKVYVNESPAATTAGPWPIWTPRSGPAPPPPPPAAPLGGGSERAAPAQQVAKMPLISSVPALFVAKRRYA